MMQVSGTAWLFHPNGMHARPAIKLTKLAKRFVSNISIGLSADGPWTDAKSIAKVLAMKTPSGVTLFIQAEGSDADAAVDALRALVASDFREDERA
jgi:phosphocarrier protein